MPEFAACEEWYNIVACTIIVRVQMSDAYSEIDVK